MKDGKIKFDKIYRYDRIEEPVFLAIPVKAGELYESNLLGIWDGDRELPSQTKVTSRYKDGSIRYLFTRFLADLPGNAKKEICYSVTRERNPVKTSLQVEEVAGGIEVDTGALSFKVKHNASHVFSRVKQGTVTYTAEQFTGPLVKTKKGEFLPSFGVWKIVEQGAVSVILETQGVCHAPEGVEDTFGIEIRITAYAGKPWVEVSCRLVNTTEERQQIEAFLFGIKRRAGSSLPNRKVQPTGGAKADSTGCGDLQQDGFAAGIFRTTGVKNLAEIEEKIDLEKVRTCVGRSNYKTNFTIGEKGAHVEEVADALLLKGEANEHISEVFYGTFFADVTDENGGVCATVYQAQQNFPKAVTADAEGIWVMLVPEGIEKVEFASGMSREQKLLLHFHTPEEPLAQLDNRSLIYQMPDFPHLLPEVFEEAGVMPEIFVKPEKRNDDVEIALVAKADGHAKGYGMMNWGDAPDGGYTEQGRGKGKLVWTNNEYDYPHAMYLMYARTGTRRFFDYANVAASHWMDVDVCHYSKNPLRIGGQWEHTYEHCGAGVMVCSHEWVEGLLDCYHFTGNERALQTALGIGENILRLLETPMYQVSGESNARETGWALRTLTALYVETWDEKWTKKCDWIVNHFREWIAEYGEWVAPYTDNTSIRVGFMISVAVGSLMRYYRVFPSEELKGMMLSAIDDLVDNCLMENGLFYYKELPSLARNGSNTLLLEAMTIGYELTGDSRYLKYGKKTFEMNVRNAGGSGGGKRIVEDTVLSGGNGTKGFAQSFLPMTLYYRACTENDLL